MRCSQRANVHFGRRASTSERQADILGNCLGDSRKHDHVASTFHGGFVNVVVMFEDMKGIFIARLGRKKGRK